MRTLAILPLLVSLLKGDGGISLDAGTSNINITYNRSNSVFTRGEWTSNKDGTVNLRLFYTLGTNTGYAFSTSVIVLATPDIALSYAVDAGFVTLGL